MTKTATQVINEAIFAAVCDAIDAFKSNAKGVPNVLVRDLSAVHANTAFDGLPETVQKAITNATQDTLKRLQKEGFTVAPKSAAMRPQAPVRSGQRFRQN